MSGLTRRSVTMLGIGGLTAGLGGCAGDTFGDFNKPFTQASASSSSERKGPIRTPDYDRIYGRITGEETPIPAFDYSAMDPAFLRANVAYASAEAPGTVVIDPQRHALYYVERGGRATRYGVGVGREGFLWNGHASINMRRAWPDWVPPREMVERDPAVYAQLTDTPRGRGVPGGAKSPLGARAMYLAANGRDTGYRIHGTWEPDTIGTNVSSGCIRMINQDIIHLYGRTVQTNPVLVLA